MEIDWSLAKKITLWHYDELIIKLLHTLAYSFVHEYYNHGMADAEDYSEKLQHHYLLNGKEATFIGEITTQFESLNMLGIKNYTDLLQKIDTKAKCEIFLKIAGLNFEALIHLLHFLYRWVLPFKCPLKELTDLLPTEKEQLSLIRKHKITSNLDILEYWRKKEARIGFAQKTGLEENYLLQLTHRADISRLAYVRGKTIKHLCAAGYDTLNKLASAHISQINADMTEYFAKMGKNFNDFKAVLPLDWMIGGACVLPKIIEA